MLLEQEMTDLRTWMLWHLLKIILGDKVITSIFNLGPVVSKIHFKARFHSTCVRFNICFLFFSFFSFYFFIDGALLFCHFARLPVDSILAMPVASCFVNWNQRQWCWYREVNRNDFNLLELHADAFENHKLHMRQPCQSQSIHFYMQIYNKPYINIVISKYILARHRS